MADSTKRFTKAVWSYRKNNEGEITKKTLKKKRNGSKGKEG